MQNECDKSSDSSPLFSCSHCKTGWTSAPLRASTYSKGLLLSGPNEQAVTCDSYATQPMPSAGSKRFRSGSDLTPSAKAARVPLKKWCQQPKSSTSLFWHMAEWHRHAPFLSEAPNPELFSPAYSGASDEESNVDLPLHIFQHSIPKAKIFPSPPPKQARLPQGGSALNREMGDSPLHLGTYSPASYIAGTSQNLLPCTPPNKHATLPIPTSGLGSPSQQFNFADFVNETPASAQSL